MKIKKIIRKILSWIKPGRKYYTVDSVEDMVSNENLKHGDTVQVLNYRGKSVKYEIVDNN